MPGIVASFGTHPRPDLGHRLDRGASAVNRLGRGEILSQDFAEGGLRVVRRPGRLPGADLWEDKAGGLLVAMDGECYGAAPGAAAKAKALLGTIPLPRGAQAMGRLYREYGPDFAVHAEGAFSVVVVDRAAGELVACTDRFGLRPLAWSIVDGALCLGSIMAAFTRAWPERTWPFDWSALADWLSFEHVLGDKTFLDGVTLLPNAGRLRFRSGGDGPAVDEYWSLASAGTSESISFDEAVATSGELFANAVGRCCADGAKAGIYITSGLDSRATAGFLARLQPGFPSVTYGLEGCRDMVWGRELALLTGSSHHAFPMDDASWLFDYADSFIGRTESFVNLLHSHGIHTYEAAAGLMDVHLSGYGGGSFYGGDTTNTAVLTATSARHACERLYKGYVNSLGNVFRSPVERCSLLTAQAREATAWAAELSFQDEFSRYASLRRDIVGDAFTLNNRYKKMFAYIIAMEREFIEDRSPFMDYALMDFLFSLPTRFRVDRKLQIGLLDQMLPDLRAVPWQVTAKCPTLLNDLPVGLASGTIDPMPTEPGRNYPKWVHEFGMDWLTRVLDSDKLEGRGVFSRDYLRELLDRVPHAMSGQPYQQQRNLAYRLGAAASFEVMCELVLDSPPGGGA